MSTANQGGSQSKAKAPKRKRTSQQHYSVDCYSYCHNCCYIRHLSSFVLSMFFVVEDSSFVKERLVFQPQLSLSSLCIPPRLCRGQHQTSKLWGCKTTQTQRLLNHGLRTQHCLPAVVFDNPGTSRNASLPVPGSFLRSGNWRFWLISPIQKTVPSSHIQENGSESGTPIVLSVILQFQTAAVWSQAPKPQHILHPATRLHRRTQLSRVQPRRTALTAGFQERRLQVGSCRCRCIRRVRFGPFMHGITAC